MKRTGKLFFAIGIGMLGLGLLTDSAAVAEGVQRGLGICAGVLIPALFPFMVLACFLANSDISRILSIPLTPITRHAFKLPGELGATVLLSFLGGYPVGAKMISSLLEQKRIKQETARRMLCFCVNPSPSFLISAVGVGMLLNRRAGVVLLLSQLIATLLIGLATSFRLPVPPSAKEHPPQKRTMNAFVTAISEASNAIIGMCAYAVLFSGLMSLLNASGLPETVSRLLHINPAIVQAVAAGLFEVTGGSMAAARLGGEAAIIGISFCASFGGLSVICQIISLFPEENAPGFGPYLLSRLTHGCLSAGIALPLYRKFCADVAVWSASTPPILHLDGKTVVVSLCLLGMCSIMALGKER